MSVCTVQKRFPVNAIEDLQRAAGGLHVIASTSGTAERKLKKPFLCKATATLPQLARRNKRRTMQTGHVNSCDAGSGTTRNENLIYSVLEAQATGDPVTPRQ